VSTFLTSPAFLSSSRRSSSLILLSPLLNIRYSRSFRKRFY